MSRGAAKESFAAPFPRLRAVALALRRLMRFSKLVTTAFSRGYTLTPLRGCSGSIRFPQSTHFSAPDQDLESSAVAWAAAHRRPDTPSTACSRGYSLSPLRG